MNMHVYLHLSFINDQLLDYGNHTTTDRAICPGSKGLFVPVLEPGFGRRDKSRRLLSRVVEPGQNVPRVKKSLRSAGFEPMTYCLAHGFLANSTK